MIGGRDTTFEVIASVATEALGALAVGDVDADSVLDIVGLAGAAEAILIASDADGALTARPDPIELGAGTTDLVLADFDGDRHLDIAVAHGTGTSIVRNNP
jgi:hypothetical protein